MGSFSILHDFASTDMDALMVLYLYVWPSHIYLYSKISFTKGFESFTFDLGSTYTEHGYKYIHEYDIVIQAISEK